MQVGYAFHTDNMRHNRAGNIQAARRVQRHIGNVARCVGINGVAVRRKLHGHF
jgi:hypothetical protein